MTRTTAGPVPGPVRRLALARFLSAAGADGAYLVGLWGRAAYDFRSEAGEIALLVVGIKVAGLVGAAVAGPLVDRFDPRRVLLVAELLAVPAALALILPDDLGTFAAVATLSGALHAVARTAVGSFAPFLADDAGGLSRVNATLEVASSSAQVAGSGLGALLGSTLGLSSVFVVDAATSLVAVALLAGLPVRRVTVAPAAMGLRDLTAGVRAVAASGALRFLLLLWIGLWILIGLFDVFESLFFRDAVGLGPAAIGVANALFGVGAVAGAALFGRVPALGGSLRAFALIVASVGACTLAYTVVPVLWVVGAGALLFGATFGLAFPARRTLVQRATPPHLIGRVTGVDTFVEQAASLLPAVLVPLVGPGWAAQPTLLSGGLVLAVAGLVAAALADRSRGQVTGIS